MVIPAAELGPSLGNRKARTSLSLSLVRLDRKAGAGGGCGGDGGKGGLLAPPAAAMTDGSGLVRSEEFGLTWTGTTS